MAATNVPEENGFKRPSILEETGQDIAYRKEGMLTGKGSLYTTITPCCIATLWGSSDSVS